MADDDVDCGVAPQIAKSSSTIRQRIIGGFEAQLGEFPWYNKLLSGLNEVILIKGFCTYFKNSFKKY